MSNALMAKLNMKGAKGEKGWFWKKKKFAHLLKVYASFFFYIFLRLYPDMPVFRSGPDFWPERILKVISSGSKFCLSIYFLLSVILLSLLEKSGVFSHSKSMLLRPKWLEIKNFPQTLLGRCYSPARLLS